MIEDLNKTQLVLLTLLVSFVTSIATGVITFSLIQEAPPIVTQTINRVVEQTIQQVTPATNDTKPGTKEVTTVVVKEEDQVIGSISKITPSIVRISDNSSTPDTNPFYGIGVIISKNGLIVTPHRSTFNSQYIYTASLSDGTSYELRYLGADKDNTMNFFTVVFKAKPVSLPAVLLANDNAKLGQTLVLIEGKDKNVVTVGRAAALTYVDIDDKKVQNGAQMDVTPKTDVVGSPVLNLTGEVIGFRVPVSVAGESPLFISPFFLRDTIAEFLKKS